MYISFKGILPHFSDYGIIAKEAKTPTAVDNSVWTLY
jgi:hypothetical protein